MNLYFAFICYLIHLPSYIAQSLFFNCDASCATCYGSNSNECITCKNSFLPTNGSCICPDGKYEISGFFSCASCNQACRTCNGPSQTNCTGCPQTSLLYQGICYPACSSSQYFNTQNKTCNSCDLSCLTCDGSTSQSCTSCASGALVSGSCKCSSGQYKDASYICQSCHNTCKECSGPSSNQCTACSTGMILSNGQCKCSTGTYMNLSPLGCLNCDSVCLGCSGPSSSECTSCKNNMILSSVGQCVCPTGTYYDSSTISCKACHSHCQECSGPLATQCISCKNNLQLSSPGEGQCDCSAEQYLDNTSMICLTCHFSCKTCTGPSSNQCDSCESIFTLSDGQCKCASGCSCPSGTYFDSSSLTCIPCNSLCKECSGPSSNQCTDCDSDKSLLADTCVCNGSSCGCPDGSFFYSGNSSCLSCYETCHACDGAESTNCTACRNNLVSLNGECTCPSGKFLQNSIMMCIDCDSSCQTCSGSSNNQCTSCKNNMQLASSGQCGCGSGFFADLGSYSCKGCNSNCVECTGPEANQCTSCSPLKILEYNYCLDVCISSQYRSSDNSCQQCSSSCLTCSGPNSNECTSCHSGFGLTQGQCIRYCHQTCNTCQGPSRYECTSCNPGFDLIQGECRSHCHQSCNVCQGTSSYECTSCANNLLFFDYNNGTGSCLGKCPSLYYIIEGQGVRMCQQKSKIDNTLAYGSAPNELNILLNRDISGDFNTLTQYIKVSMIYRVEQPRIGFTFFFRLAENKRELILAVSFSGHLLPGSILVINYTDIRDNENIEYYMAKNVQQIRLSEYYQYSESMQAVINATAKINSISSQTNGALSLSSAFVLRTVHSMRSEIVEDMLSFFVFMNIDFPPNFVQFVNSSGGSFEFILPNLQADLTEDVSTEGPLRLLQDTKDQSISTDDVKGSTALQRYVKTRIFLVNEKSQIILFIIAFAVITIVELATRAFSKPVLSTKKSIKFYFSKITDYVSFSMRWNFILNRLVSVYLELTFYALTEVSNVRPLRTGLGYLKYISGVIGLLVTTVALIGLPFLIFRVYKILKKSSLPVDEQSQTEKEKNLLRRLEIVYFPYKKDRYIELLYPFFLILRSFVFALFLIFLQDSPYTQCIYIAVATVMMICYLLYVKPFKIKSQQILTVLYELFFLLASCFAIALHGYNQNNLADIETRTNLGFSICSCNLAMTVLNFINIGIEIWTLKKKLELKKKVIPMGLAIMNIKANRTFPNKKENENQQNPTIKTVNVKNLKTIHEQDTIGKTENVPLRNEIMKSGESTSRFLLSRQKEDFGRGSDLLSPSSDLTERPFSFFSDNSKRVVKDNQEMIINVDYADYKSVAANSETSPTVEKSKHLIQLRTCKRPGTSNYQDNSKGNNNNGTLAELDPIRSPVHQEFQLLSGTNLGSRRVRFLQKVKASKEVNVPHETAVRRQIDSSASIRKKEIKFGEGKLMETPERSQNKVSEREITTDDIPFLSLLDSRTSSTINPRVGLFKNPEEDIEIIEL